MSLIFSYIWQEVRKCSSVSTSFCLCMSGSVLQRAGEKDGVRSWHIQQQYCGDEAGAGV